MSVLSIKVVVQHMECTDSPEGTRKGRDQRKGLESAGKDRGNWRVEGEEEEKKKEKREIIMRVRGRRSTAGQR